MFVQVVVAMATKAMGKGKGKAKPKQAKRTGSAAGEYYGPDRPKWLGKLPRTSVSTFLPVVA